MHVLPETGLPESFWGSFFFFLGGGVYFTALDVELPIAVKNDRYKTLMGRLVGIVVL